MPLVALAQILKEQSFPKDGVRTYKVQLINRGSDLIKNLKLLVTNEALPRDVLMKAEAQPLGGAWKIAQFAVISVSEDMILNSGTMLLCHSEDFPKLSEETEFYLSDILGFEVIDELGDRHGKIEGFYFDSSKVAGPVNLRIVRHEQEFECPQEWITHLDLANKTVLIEGVYRWKI